MHFIGLIFANIPLQAKEFISVFFNISKRKFAKSFQIFGCKVSLLNLVQIAFICDLHINYELIFVFSVEDTVDHAELPSDKGHEGRVISILYAFVNHVDLVCRFEDVTNEYEVPCTIKAIKRLKDHIDQGRVLRRNICLHLNLFNILI